MSDLSDLSIADAGRRLRAGELTATMLTEHALGRIAALDPLYHAFIRLTPGPALEAAARADRELSQGIDRGPLLGIPVGLKDLIDIAGIPTTAGSNLLLDNVPGEDAAVTARLIAGGAVLLGKLATYELAIEPWPGDDTPFPPARNPRSLDHITGGSSSGSAAAVAGGLVRVALGTDTGGSVRSPACYCGVVGLKPTYGLVSRRGVFPLSYSLDHVGPLAASVEDAALTLNVIAGYDAADPASVDLPREDYARDIGRPIDGMGLAYARNFYIADIEPGVGRAIDDAVERLAALGADIEEVELPAYELFDACATVILESEAFAIHAHNLSARPADFGRLAYKWLAAGAVLSAGDLVQAQRLRRHLCETLNRDVFGPFDAMITANVLSTAPRADAAGEPSLYGGMRTFPFNVTGHPALAVPLGTHANGLPIGLQLVGRPFGEALLCQLGAACEASQPRPGATRSIATSHPSHRPLHASGYAYAPTDFA